MRIDFNSIVSMHFCLALEDGQLLECSFDHEPLNVEMGSGMLVPGLEKALYHHKAGDQFHVAIKAEEAYGIYDEHLKKMVSKAFFEGVEEFEPGMQFECEEDGGVRIYTVTQVMEEMVTVDGNHPLAGQNLLFDIEILSVESDAANQVLDSTESNQQQAAVAA